MEKENQIFFASKEENNDRRVQEFLSKTPHERFILFLERAEETLFQELNHEHPNHSKNNFIVE